MLTDDDRDTLRDWWDEDTTASVESAFPIIARIVARERAAVLREAADDLARHMLPASTSQIDAGARAADSAAIRRLRARADREATP